MLVLFETPAGYALFKVLKKDITKNPDDIWKSFATPDKAASTVKLKAFHKFEDTQSALAAATSICDGKLDKSLKKFLKKTFVDKLAKSELAVAEAKFGGLIKEKTGIQCVFDDSVGELLRGIRSQMDSLVSGLSEEDSKAMKLGLSHSLARYKIKFSPDKVDTMIVQAISLLDELDKELNTYAMRVREWYGWHFPEMGKVVTEPLLYSKVVQKMGVRTNASTCDLSDVLEEETEAKLKEDAEVSMGSDIAEEDIVNITLLCDQVVHLSNYRTELYEYLKNRMNAIAPNLTCMVGELVGARLIAHAGSLMSLAKHPASTVQILGAEKALFRALKTKHDTPKYGLLYHASLVGQAAPKNKGKISRVLAAKCALSIRMDALGDSDGVTIGLDARAKVEQRLQELEGGVSRQLSGKGKGIATQKKHEKAAAAPTYNEGADVTMTAGKEEKKKKKKKDKKRKLEEATAVVSEEKEAKKKKKKQKTEAGAVAVGEEKPKKEKKKKSKKSKKA
jgi:nucleolar protein 58